MQKKPQKVQKKMALYKTFLTVRQEKAIKCPKNCVFWNPFLHQNPGFPGFLCISRVHFCTSDGVFLHLLEAFFLTVLPVDKTFRTLNLLNYNIFLVFVYRYYKCRCRGICKGEGVFVRGIIYKNSVQVFPRPSIYDGGLPQPNL